MSENKTWLAHYPESISKEISIPNQSLGAILQNTAKNYPEHNALSRK